MAALTAAQLAATARRVVIKIGSALLVDGQSGRLREDWLAGLAADVAHMRGRGQDVVIVSSGSIALGRHVLGLGDVLSLDQSQAAAAVGQIKLARAYEAALAAHVITTAQVLVTLEDSANRRRYLNSRATLDALIAMKCVPIVNENDTVATDEIRFGDNDRLAAQVATLCGADLLCLLSDIDGLYDADPNLGQANHIPLVDAITPGIEAMAGGSANRLAKGGMRTKIMAARTATAAGSAMVILKGDRTRPMAALESGATATVFAAKESPASARKHWIDAMKPRGVITIDAGAAAALGRGKSLLPAGVTGIEGDFDRGDPIEIRGPDGHLIARGLTAYDGTEARAIAGAQSGDIAGILGHPGRAALVHRDNMAL